MLFSNESKNLNLIDIFQIKFFWNLLFNFFFEHLILLIYILIIKYVKFQITS